MTAQRESPCRRYGTSKKNTERYGNRSGQQFFLCSFSFEKPVGFARVVRRSKDILLKLDISATSWHQHDTSLSSLPGYGSFHWIPTVPSLVVPDTDITAVPPVSCWSTLSSSEGSTLKKLFLELRVRVHLFLVSSVANRSGYCIL